MNQKNIYISFRNVYFKLYFSSVSCKQYFEKGDNVFDLTFSFYIINKMNKTLYQIFQCFNQNFC